MGQRSQIYVRLETEDNKTLFVARYFQWCYAERLVSRARSGIEWCYAHFPYLHLQMSELNRIFDVNFDMHDIVISSDLIEEWKKYGTQFDCTMKDYVFNADNNDGRLLIDINEKTKKIKYCFVDYDNNYLGDAESYINWELQSCRDDYDFVAHLKQQEQYENFTSNIEYLKKNATPMTEKQAKEFINFNYEEVI